MQVREHFDVREFVPPEIWSRHEAGILDARWYIRPDVLDIAQAVRDRYGRPVWVNTWPRDEDGHTERGYRLGWTDTGATYSMHKLGCAVDFSVQGMSSAEVFDDVTANQSTFFRHGVRAIEHKEDTPGWTHLDIRPTALDGQIQVVNA